MFEKLEETIDLLNKASQICYELKVENVDNPDWHHFVATWVTIGKAIKELKIVRQTLLDKELVKRVVSSW